MSQNQDGAVLGESETVTVNTEASTEAEATDLNATDLNAADLNAADSGQDVTAPGEVTEPELTDEQKAEAEAKAKAEAEAEAARIEALVTDFQNLIGVKDDDGNWTGGLMASEDREASTGQIPEGVLNDLRAKFNDLPTGAPRTKIKNWVDAQISEAMEDPALSPYARSFFMIKKHSLVSTGAAKAAPKVQLDPTQAFVDQVVALYIAPFMVQVPDGVAQNWADLVNAESEKLIDVARDYAEHQNKIAAHEAKVAEHEAKVQALPEDATDEQRSTLATEGEALTAEGEALEKATAETSDVVKVGFRLARGRAASAPRAKKASTGGTSGGTSTTRAPRGDGTRKNIATHILNAFAGKPVGTILSINEVVKTPSDEYGSESPSPGAVSARLFPDKNDPANGDKCTVPGVVGVINTDGRKAAKLVSQV